MSGDLVADSLLAGARFLWYAGLLGVIGAGAFHLLVLPSATAQDSGPASAPAATGLTAAILLLAGILARLYAQTYATFGVEEPVTMALLLEVGTALPPWSSGWTLQAGAAVAALAALLIARAGFRAGWIGAQAAAVALAGTAPFTAHAAAQGDGYALVMVMHASHVLGAGIWLGGLFVLFIEIARTRTRALDPDEAARLVRAFSPLALVGASLLVLTGLMMAGIYLTTVSDLWTTGYGRALAMKIAMSGGVVAAGFVNWQRVRPQLTTAIGVGRLRRTAAVELMLAAVVIAVTALLTGFSPPAG